MLRGARVIAIDDRKSDLDGIVAALHRSGVGVLPFHYKGQTSVRKCACGIRVVFADINIVPSAANVYQQHQAIAAVLDRILDPANGPWVLVAWTASPHQVPALKTVLENNLGRDRAPVSALGLDKSLFAKPNGAFDVAGIAKAIDKEVSRDPVARAILDLEMRASGAAHDVTRLITGLATANAPADLGQILVAMATAADARKQHEPEHVFETLGPVFQDRLIRRGVSPAERKIWHDAFVAAAAGPLGDEQRAKLNSALHVDQNVYVGARGALTLIPAKLESTLEKACREPLRDLAFRHFVKRDKAVSAMREEWKRMNAVGAAGGSATKPQPPADDTLAASFLSGLRWALLEIVPACDVANDKRGVRRAAVVLIVPGKLGEQKPAGEYVQSLPVFVLETQIVRLFVTAKVTLSPVPRGLAARKPIARIRDQLLDGLTQCIAGSQSRLGWTSF